MLTKFPSSSRLRTPEMLLMLMAAAAPLSCLVPLAPARGNEVRAVIASRAAVMR